MSLITTTSLRPPLKAGVTPWSGLQQHWKPGGLSVGATDIMQPIGDLPQNLVEKLFPSRWIDCCCASGTLVKRNKFAAIRLLILKAGEHLMLNVLKTLTAVALILSGSVAQAGGPVIIEEGNDAVIEEKPVRSAGILPIIGALVLVCLVVCGDDEEEPAPVPPK